MAAADEIARLEINVQVQNADRADRQLARIEDRTARVERVTERKRQADARAQRQMAEMLRFVEQVGRALGVQAGNVEMVERALRQLEARERAVGAATQQATRAANDNARALAGAAAAQRQFTTTATASTGALRTTAAEHTRAAAATVASTGAARAATGGLRNFGSVAQAAGFQVADFAVQVGAGQSALVALTQQGSQVLQFFGPFGAVLGAAAAVVGALAIAFFNSRDAAKESKGAFDAYNDTLKRTKGLSDEAAGSARNLAGAHRDAAVAALEKAQADAVAAQDLLTRQLRAQQAYVDALRQGAQGGGVAGSAAELREAEKDLKRLTDEFDRNSEAIGGVDSRLTLLRDTLAKVEEASKSTAGGTATLTGAVDRQGEAVAETIADLQVELRYREELAKAHQRGADAVHAVEDAYQAYELIQRLKIAADSAEAQEITRLVVQINDQRRAIEKINPVQREIAQEAQRSAADFAASASTIPDEAAEEFGALITEALQ